MGSWGWHNNLSYGTRCAIFVRDGKRCAWCNRKVKFSGGSLKKSEASDRCAQLDHVIPRAEGGNHKPTNLVTACARCNRRGVEARPPERYPHVLELLALPLDRKAGRKFARRIYPWIKNLSSGGKFRQQKCYAKKRERAAMQQTAIASFLEDIIEVGADESFADREGAF